MPDSDITNEKNKLVVDYGVPYSLRAPFATVSFLVFLWILKILYGYVDLMIEFGPLYPPFIPLGTSEKHPSAALAVKI